MKENETITMVMLPKSEWEEVLSTLNEIKELLRTKSKEEINGEWVESVEARKLLGVSPKTWQNYRDERRIPFSQFGRKIFVKRADLESFMEQHYVEAGGTPRKGVRYGIRY